MMTPRARSTPTTASPRFGQGRAALPNDPGLDDLLADTRVGSTAKAIAVALVKNWAWYKTSCYPSDRTIAGKIGKSPGHIQRCLRQLENVGWIVREKTDQVASGRRIWLCWRCPDGGQGARSSPTPARGWESAPARIEQVVVEQEEAEQGVQIAAQRLRSDPPALVRTYPMTLALDQFITTCEQAPKVCPETAPPPGDNAFLPPPPAIPARVREAISFPQDTAQPVVAVIPDATPREPVEVMPTRSALLTPNGPLAVLTPVEQVRFWELTEATQKRILTWLSLEDRICLGEARKLLTPPPPPEPPPWSLATSELLAGLPGRRDRVAAVADRLCEELKDPRSFNFYLSVAGAVCQGQHPATALVSAWRQGTNPKSVRPGAVFSFVWKRETSSG